MIRESDHERADEPEGAVRKPLTLFANEIRAMMRVHESSFHWQYESETGRCLHLLVFGVYVRLEQGTLCLRTMRYVCSRQ